MSAKTIVLAVILVLWGTSAYAADCNNGGRYEDMGDGTVQDCRTGLIWLNDANCTENLALPGIDKSDGRLNWYDAMKWVAALGGGWCGLTDYSSAGDWRLPTRTEWMAMIASARKQGFTHPILTGAAGTSNWTEGDVFTNVVPNFYWSSTSSTNGAFAVDMDFGGLGFGPKSEHCYVWPVRGGQSGEFGSITIQ